MEKGNLIEFRLHGNRHIAVVNHPEGKKHWVVVDEQNRSHTLHPRQITYQVSGQAYEPADISHFLKEAHACLDPSSLEVAWELLVEDDETTDPAALALLLFSDQSPPFCYAAYYLLSEDKLYFKHKGDRYEPRSIAQVAELKHQLAVEAERVQEWQGFLARAQQVLSGELVEWQKSDRSRIEALERFAVFGEESNYRAQALETLSALGRSEHQQAAFQVLVDLKLWSLHENLPLRRHQIPTQFSDRVLEMLQQYLASPIPDPDSNRLDLTHLKAFTIDDESTREIDDGLSLEYLPDGKQQLWIHIADPTRWLIPGDALDLEARRRCTTIYLPTGMIPMFPTELATGPMSLTQGKTCHALSFSVILDETGGVQDYSIHASLIKPTYRLTYDDVDEILQLGLQTETELEALALWSNRRQAWRASQGAISIHMPESSIKVHDDEIDIQVLDDSPARQMVAEMMILAGEVAARYGQAHNLAIPFRNQPQPELPPANELMLLPAGPVRDCAIRRCMPRSEMGTTPIRHATLGLDTYTQVTSPIRRYADLMAHFQIKAHLRGDPLPFASEELKELIQGVSTAAYEATLVERQTNRYWGLEYLRRSTEKNWQALMLRWLREHENLGLVMLEELGLELAMRFNRSIAPGDRLQIKVTYANPRQDVIQLDEVMKSGT
ncbi:MAG: VacB/RNase II family 3'-5' exoribonuclease [Cyanothece sp. SIO1E1]|nr:VacB/RNase II family 3'-5' exoribonuclease [Cyanothece sp. SIO1E1]